MRVFKSKPYAIYITVFCLFFGLFSVLFIHFKDNKTIEYYIAINGNDVNPGTKQKPLATLDGAQHLIKNFAAKNQGVKDIRINVYIRGGKYYLDKSFTLDKIDSDNTKVSILFKPYENEIVSFIGGKEIYPSQFNKVEDKNILNRLPKDKTKNNVLVFNMSENKIKFGSIQEGINCVPELFVDGKPIILARWPNEGYETTGKIISSGDSSMDLKNGFVFQYLNPRIEQWKEVSDVWMGGYWRYNWWDDVIKMNSIDSKNKYIKTDQGSEFGIATNQRYYYFNVLEELDTPGEGYIDRSNGLFYIYPESALNSSVIQISQLQGPFIIMNNTSNVELQGLIFEVGKGTGIIINGGSNNSVNGCTIRNLEGNAVTLNQGINNGVKNCNLYNLGTGGIVIDSGNRELLTSSNNYVDNNDIYNYSRIKKTYSAAVKISGVGNIITHNSIHNAPHTAIWFSGNDNKIEYNEIYSVAEDTDDAGAIYSGRDWTYRGNVIRYNFLHDIKNSLGGKDACGVYLDDCMSSAEVIGNIFYRVNHALLLGGGRDHIVKNNIIASCSESLSFDDRGLKSNLDTLQGNLKKVPVNSTVWRQRYPKLYELLTDKSPGIPKGNIVSENLLYNSGEPYISKPVNDYGQISQNICFDENPGFKDIKNMDFELNNDSMVFKEIPQFIHIPFDKIGMYKNKYRKNLN